MLLLHYMDDFLVIGVGKDKTVRETQLLAKCLKEARALVSTKSTGFGVDEKHAGACDYNPFAREVHGHSIGAYM